MDNQGRAKLVIAALAIMLIAVSVRAMLEPRTIAVPVEIETPTRPQPPAPSADSVQTEKAREAKAAAIARAHRAATAASLPSGALFVDIGGERVDPGASSTRGVTLPPGSRTLRIMNIAPGFTLDASADSPTADGAGVWSQYVVTNANSAPARFSADVVYSASGSGSGS